MTWSTNLPDDLKNSECERTDVTKNGGAPPVRTVPEKDSGVEDAQSTYIYTSEDVKEEFPKFSGGSKEGALIHVSVVREIIAKLELIEQYEAASQLLKSAEDARKEMTPAQKASSTGRDNKAEIEELRTTMKDVVAKAFKIFQDLLETKLVPGWLQAVKVTCKTEGYVTWDGVRVEGRKRGMSFDSLDATIRYWLINTGSFPPDSAERIERYLSSQIKMPTRKEIEFKAYAKRLVEICDYMPDVPAMKDIEGSPPDLPRANVKPPDLKICQYILNAIPHSWSNMYWSRKGEHFPTDVEKLVADLALIEPEFRAEQARYNKDRNRDGSGKAKARNGGDRSSKMKEGDRIPKKPKSEKAAGAAKSRRLCQKCAQYSPETKNSHNTGQCRKWNEDGSRKQAVNNSNMMVQQPILDCFATLQKQGEMVLKEMKKANKKRRKKSRKEESDSDSDSD